ncbi:restriction endonuclease subunit S [Streptomyces sp. ML-6]|uniref:restriction endonuclease subunit S n=1 Tax=Streptomyces sp. ML-6 TaxID=2982693 RepID=UPI0024C0B237|nr:restriction endonuclease subunit S [Streptomyces sp. ML-6]MDK0523298.1 restriction endonuclease subunit S [Streptomyces sp. ML-6]
MSGGLFTTMPSAWGTTRLDHVATVHARIGWKALTAAEYQLAGYPFLATPNIKTPKIDFENVNYISKFRFDESPELKLQNGDVLLAKDGSTLGIVNVVTDLQQEATVNGSIAVLRAFGIDPRFLRFVIASSVIQGHIGSVKDGMGVPHLFQRDIKRFQLPLPPIEEQRRIADFLDAETARIDRLISKRRAQSQALSEQGTSHLSNTYQGLSGQYGVIRLRHMLMRIEQGWSPQCEDRTVEGDEWGIVKAGCVNSGNFDPRQHKALPTGIQPRREYTLRSGDLLMSRASGSSDLIGSVGIVQNLDNNLLLCDKVYRIKLDRTLGNPEFVAHMLRSHRVREHIKNGISGAEGMANNLPTAVVKDCVVPKVPVEKQMSVVASLDRSAAKTKQARRLLSRSVDGLAERRQALITAAVTGQFDVSTASGRNVTDGVHP